jgi:hypothetical protein
MRNFLLDLWQDLREKRLWPVAAVLLGALVAVPLLLGSSVKHPSQESAKTSPAAQARDKALAALKVQAGNGQQGEGSKLNVFDSKNPFRPPAAVARALTPGGTSAATSLPTTTSSTTSSSSTPTSSSSTLSPSSSGSTPSGSSGGSTSAPSAPGGGSTGRRRVTRFTFVVDLTLTHNDHSRRFRSLRPPAVLPSAESPLLLYLGVDARGDNAVFLVDSSLSTTGEGRCAPSRSQCAVLYLGAGSEQDFTDGRGNSYTLQIDEIRKVKLATRARAARRRHKRAHTAEARRSRHVRAAKVSVRQFVSPLLTELVSVASADQPRSSGSKQGR